jgi:hypothetical protein
MMVDMYYEERHFEESVLTEERKWAQGGGGG